MSPTRIWYELSKLAKRIREDIAHYATKKVWGENYDSSYREHQLMLRKIEDLRDQFGRALMEAKGKPGDGKRALKLLGVAEDGKKIYQGNFPKGTPKSAKSEKILKYITDVWSKKPIRLEISNGETSRIVYAKFDPTVDESKELHTDATKIAGGNRHGTSSEQRVTLDLGDDYYEIASESKYNYSKLEEGKDTFTHDGVQMWHYFVNDIYFAEYGETNAVPYTVTINVKEKADGDYVYSFSAEKEPSTRRTLHADVSTRKGTNGELFIDNSISPTTQKSNKQTVNNTSGKSLSLSRANTTPQNELETQMKAQALSLYDDMRKAQKAQRTTDITEESIYEQTGLSKATNPCHLRY